MYEKSCYKSSTLKDERSELNVNIFKILHLPFDMLCYSLKIMMVRSKMYWQSASRSKRPVVQNRPPSTTK